MYAGLLDLSRQSDWSDPEQVQESAVAEGTPRSAFSSLGVPAGLPGARLENSRLTARAGLCEASREGPTEPHRFSSTGVPAGRHPGG